MKHTLYIASKSSSRKMLLEDAQIPYAIIDQNADESHCDWNRPLLEVVQNIASYKMGHAVLPAGNEGQIIFVITADTLGLDTHGKLRGKPADFEEAIAFIKAARGVNICATAFCLEKKVFKEGAWHTLERTLQSVQATYELDIPDDQIESYLKISNALEAAGAIKIGGYGSKYIKSINGSFTAIIGLPLFELRVALTKMGFFL